MPRKTYERLRSGSMTKGASMRPRPDAAENSAGRGTTTAGRLASMRPRPDAAENPDWKVERDCDYCGFNEAAARCRGKRPLRPP